ncbi:MAG: hypothetical protein JWM43_1917 [Acidobacteriaceae bacterium]|nr:hypothetical protein [Acidobacteriaceae bacterium]
MISNVAATPELPKRFSVEQIVGVLKQSEVGAQ